MSLTILFLNVIMCTPYEKDVKNDCKINQKIHKTWSIYEILNILRAYLLQKSIFLFYFVTSKATSRVVIVVTLLTKCLEKKENYSIFIW